MAILLGIFSGIIYFIIGCVIDKFLNESDTPSLLILIGWPLIVALFIIIFPICFVHELIKNSQKK